ncbi:g2333 [Coccomyxa elongata]
MQQTSLRGAQLKGSRELSDLLEGCEETIEARLKDSPDVTSFFLELRNLLDKLLRFRPPLEPPSSTFYTGLISEIDEIGWDRLSWLCPNLSALHVSIADTAGRLHLVKVQLPAAYPEVAPLVTAQLPEQVKLPAWQPGACTLQSIIKNHEDAIASLQDLWACLEDLDREAWVLEPENPTFADVSRRVALGGHCSLLLTLDPARPRARPSDIRFMGSEAAAGPLHARLHAADAAPWDAARLPRENLERVLQMKLPTRSTSALDDISGDCCICYAYRHRRAPADQPSSGGDSHGEVPDQSCGNPQCARLFHRSCIREWLLALPTSRRSFNTLFGECPYCSQPITVTVS